MALTFIPLDRSNQALWDQFVDENPHAWIGHHSAIIEFEQARGNRSHAHLALGPKDKVIGVCPLFMVTDMAARFVPLRSLVTGCSLRGGPLIDAAMGARKRRDFFRDWAAWIMSYARGRQVDLIRASFPHVFGDQHNTEIYPFFPLLEHGFQQTTRYTLLMDLAGAPEELLGAMRREVRKDIRKTLKAGAEVRPITDRSQWLGECHHLNLETFGSKGLTAYSPEVMQIVWDRFVSPGLADILGVWHEGKLLTVQVNVGTAGSTYSWLGFNRRDNPLPGSHRLAILRSMESHRALGRSFFEIGSMEFDDPEQRAISRFKRSMGGEVRSSMDGQLVLSELKLASLNWLQICAGAARSQAAKLRAAYERRGRATT